MQKKIIGMPVLAGVFISLMALASCATTGGVDYAQLAAGGEDVFAGKNWNAPRRNNMYDRWEFNADGTFHFWHVHHGEPLDRGVYRYELKDGIISIAKEGADHHSRYSYVFSGKTVTLTPFHHAAEQGDTEHAESAEHGTPAAHKEPSAAHKEPPAAHKEPPAKHKEPAAEHAASEGHQMGALPEAPVTFTHAR
ncbi:MAG: hypothetical protein LBP29_00620 [Treponema sp.]|jgi:hypothetical protein|nr:hypothetical protein [Treponema sp.]